MAEPCTELPEPVPDLVIDADAHVNEDVAGAGPRSRRLHPGWLGAGRVRRPMGGPDRRRALPDPGGARLRRADRPLDQPGVRRRRRRRRPAARRHGRRGHRRPGAVRWPGHRPVHVRRRRASPATSPRLQRLAARRRCARVAGSAERRRRGRRCRTSLGASTRWSGRRRSARSPSPSRRCVDDDAQPRRPVAAAVLRGGAPTSTSPVCIHSAPGMNVPLPAAGRFSNYAQVHCLSFPADQMVALTALAMGGVLDRFPHAARRLHGVGHRLGALLRPPHARAPREARPMVPGHDAAIHATCSSGASASSPSRPKSRCSPRASSTSAPTPGSTRPTTRTGTPTSPAPSTSAGPLRRRTASATTCRRPLLGGNAAVLPPVPDPF